MFGKRAVLARGWLVIGDVVLFWNQDSIALRSYVKPSAANTGSRMISCIRVQWGGV